MKLAKSQGQKPGPTSGRRSVLQVPVKPKDKLTEALENLEATAATLLRFRQANEKVLATLSELEEAHNLACEEVKTAAKTVKRSAVSANFEVKYGKSYSRWHDADILVEKLNEEWAHKGADAGRKFIDAVGLVKIEKVVDEKLLGSLIEADKIPEAVVRASYKEELKSESCSIKPRVKAVVEDGA